LTAVLVEGAAVGDEALVNAGDGPMGQLCGASSVVDEHTRRTAAPSPSSPTATR